jgi:hypothetical protein
MVKQSFIRPVLLALAIVAVFLAVRAEPAHAQPGARSEAPVFWIWDATSVTGESRLIRTPSGLSAVFHTSSLQPGHAMTLWFIVFNNPSACTSTPCSFADTFNPDTGFDFLAGGGHVTGNGARTTVGGHLPVFDNTGSGNLEYNALFGTDFPAPGLTSPFGAEVHLAIHSHGPAQTGQTLVEQISSFFGGCALPFLGDEAGFATGFDDVPLNDAECSTIQYSVHLP